MINKVDAIYKVTGIKQNHPTGSEFFKTDKETGKRTLMIFANFDTDVKTQNSYNNIIVDEHTVIWRTKPYMKQMKSDVIKSIIEGMDILFFARTKNSGKLYEEMGVVKDWEASSIVDGKSTSFVFRFNDQILSKRGKIQLGESDMTKHSDITGLEAEQMIIDLLHDSDPFLLDKLNIEKITDISSTRRKGKTMPYDILVNNNIRLEIKSVEKDLRFTISDPQLKEIENGGYLVLVNIKEKEITISKEVKDINFIGSLHRHVCELIV